MRFLPAFLPASPFRDRIMPDRTPPRLFFAFTVQRPSFVTRRVTRPAHPVPAGTWPGSSFPSSNPECSIMSFPLAFPEFSSLFFRDTGSASARPNDC
jgi:hypothetical protein